MITDLKINEEKKKEYYEKGYWTHDTIRDVWERQAQANADKEYVCLVYTSAVVLSEITNVCL